MRKEQEKKGKEKKRKEKVKEGKEGSRGAKTFVPVGNTTRYKCEAFVPGISPGTNTPPHLYKMLFTGSIPGTNEGYEPVQIPVFPVVDSERLICWYWKFV
jgi:hypothetical protein